MAFLKEKIEIGVEEAELKVQNVFFDFSPRVRLYLIILVILIIPTYFLVKFTAQKVWLSKNQNLTVAAKPSFTNPKTPTKSEVYVVYSGGGTYTAAIEISNPNLDLSFKNEAYQFRFFNASKQQVYQFSGSTFLMPDQKKVLTVPKFVATEPVSFAEFSFLDDIRWQKRIDPPTITLTSSKPKFYDQLNPPAFVAEGDIVNGSPYTLKEVRLVFLVRDLNDKLIGISQRDENNIKPGERRAYKQLWPDLSGVNVKTVDLSVYSNPFDPNNLSE